MASYKESQVIRPQSSHRMSMGSTPASTSSSRLSTSRHHSHSVSLGAANSSHRITRRKSINAGAAHSAAAVAAALQEEVPGVSKRRSFNLKTTGSNRGFEPIKHEGSTSDQYPFIEGYRRGKNTIEYEDFAVADEFLSPEHAGSGFEKKARRASEGSHLTKSEGKRSGVELRCEKCGKEYKHSSCLTKHLWEHTPEWSYTSKLSISKHQQVQLLEAASVLVGMNQDEIEVGKATDSDHSSASPAASGYSDAPDNEDFTSAETTPPPISDHYGAVDGVHTDRGKRYSGNSLSFSRSYQSAPSSSVPAGSAFNQYHQQRRPSTSGLGSSSVDEEEAGLVAAVETLCTFGTPRNGPVLLPADVPPVPPLPARYVEANVSRLSSRAEGVPGLDLSSTSYQPFSDQDVNMTDKQRDEDHEHERYQDQSEDDDDGVFGTMEGISQA